MKKTHSEYALLGLKALERAARKVAEDARKNNYKIPVWKNGRIVYEIPLAESGQSYPDEGKISAE